MPETTHVISKRWDTRMKYHVLMNLFDEMGILMKWVSCLMDVYVYVPSGVAPSPEKLAIASSRFCVEPV